MSGFGQTSLTRSDMSNEYWTCRLDSRELACVLQISDKSVRQVGSDMSCFGRTYQTACFLIKSQNYLAGFSKA
jgi:hypothetical protein